MADYFVSKSGNDSTGTGSASNPWLTIGKALAAGSTVSLTGGARVFVGPGVYYEAVTLGLSPGASTTLEVIGDVDGSGFTAGGGVGTSGTVFWTSWTNETTTTSNRCLGTTSGSYVTVRNFIFVGGQASGGCFFAGGGATNWTFRNCVFRAHNAGSSCVYWNNATAGLNLTVDSCDFYVAPISNSVGLQLLLPEAAAEYSIGTTVVNCRFFGGSRSVSIGRISNTGLGFLCNGLAIRNCLFHGCNSGSVQFFQGAALAIATANQITGCIFSSLAAGIEVAAASQATEDWNIFTCCTTNRSGGISAGSNTQNQLLPTMQCEYNRGLGGLNRPDFGPTDSTLWKLPAAYAFAPATDRFGRTRAVATGTAIGPVVAADDPATPTTIIFQCEA